MTLRCVRAPALSSDRITEIHIFDLDRTLVRCNSGLLFAKYLYDASILTRRQWWTCMARFTLYLAGCSSMQSQMNSIFNTFFRSRPFYPMQRYLEPFWNQQLQHQLRPSLLTQLKAIQQKGQLVALFSAGPDFLVEYVAKQLGFHFVLATEYRLDRSGSHFHLLGQVADGRLKAQAVERLRYRFKKATVWGYSDSREDREFLKSVDHAWLVAPDRVLRKWALNQPHAAHWPKD